MELDISSSEDEAKIKINHKCKSLGFIPKGEAQFIQAKAKYSDYPPKVPDL